MSPQEEAIYHSILLSPGVTAAFYFLLVLPELSTFLLMHIYLTRLHKKQCKFSVKNTGSAHSKKERRRRKEDWKESKLAQTQKKEPWLNLTQNLRTGIILLISLARKWRSLS